jgi:hypothetical protein
MVRQQNQALIKCCTAAFRLEEFSAESRPECQVSAPRHDNEDLIDYEHHKYWDNGPIMVPPENTWS